MNRLTKTTKGSTVKDFEYDNNGNLLTEKINNAVVRSYEYDNRNQLRKVKAATGQEIARYDYDFERRRLSKLIQGVQIDYSYAGNQIVAEYTGNQLTNSYTLGANEVVKAELSNEGERLYYSDALGSVTALSQTTILTARNEYGSFGEIISNSGATYNSIGYTGQRLDAESGLMALGNGERYYSPELGRFIQQDSWTGILETAQSMNRFAYAYNNPLKFVDPSGNEGLVAEKIRDKISSNYDLTNNDTLNWWLNFGAHFVAGTNYDAANFASLGTMGAADVMAKDALQGKQVSFSDAWMRNGYGVSTTQIATNFLHYGAGVANGVKNVVVGISALANGLATNPGETLNQMYHGLAEMTGSAVDAVVDPRGALDKLAQHSQEEITFG